MENLMPFNDFFRYFIFALYGAVAYVILDVLNRNVESPRTPKDFSWAFFWKDNKVRFVYLFILANETKK